MNETVVNEIVVTGTVVTGNRRGSNACTNPLANSPHGERIVIIRLGAVGDVVRTIPSARRIRAAYPDARLSWLVEPSASDILRTQDWIDEVIVFPRSALVKSLRSLNWVNFSREVTRFVRRLRTCRFDLVVDFHSILRSGILSLATGATTRVAYAPPFGREFSHWFATQRATLRSEKISRFERNAALVDFLAIPRSLQPSGGALLELARGSHRQPHASSPLSSPVALHPGTSDGAPYKRYGTASFGEVAREILAATGVRSIVTWGPGRDDHRLASEVVAASSGAAELAPQTTGLDDLAELLAGCRLFVGGDTGPLHLASLVGTPVVQILGPTDPIENAPFAETPSRVVRQPVACSPCRRGCSAVTCMRGIPPKRVVDAACELLGEGDGASIAQVAGAR